MESLEVNKVCAALLVAGIAFMGSTLIGEGLVHPERLAKSAITIEGAAAPVAAAGAAEPQQPIAVFLATADVAAGESTAKKICAACHTFTDGGKAGVGPNLYNVIGGPHGHMEGYSYSEAIKSKQGPWTFDELNEWLTKPSAYAPGTKMGFAGLPSEKQRADVIDYLDTLSKTPVPLPVADKAPAPAGGNSAHGAGGAAAGSPTQTTPTEKAAGSAAATAPQGAAPAK